MLPFQQPPDALTNPISAVVRIVPALDPEAGTANLTRMDPDLGSLLAKARRERPAPLPRDFADRVLRQALRRSESRPVILSPAGILTTAAAAVIAAAAISWEIRRPAPSAEPPPLRAFSPPLAVR